MLTTAADPSTTDPVTIEDLWRGQDALSVPACALMRAVARLAGDSPIPCALAGTTACPRFAHPSGGC